MYRTNPVNYELYYRQLDVHYPIFPSEKDLVQSILGDGEKNLGGLGLLSDFAIKLERLKIGKDLLPDLVEFYTWIHTNLSHVLTMDRASTVSISQIIEQAENKMSRESGRHLRDLYVRVQQQYNYYLEHIGSSIGVDACNTENIISKITDNTNILHFLSGNLLATLLFTVNPPYKLAMKQTFVVYLDTEREGEGNDCLYIVISDIVKVHNETIHKLYRNIEGNKNLPICRLLPDEPTTISILEVTKDSAIIGQFSEYVHCSRSQNKA